MKRGDVIKEIEEFLRLQKSYDNPAISLLMKLEDMGMFYCPVEKIGDLRLRTPKGFEEDFGEELTDEEIKQFLFGKKEE